METLQQGLGISLSSSFIPRLETTFKELGSAEAAAVRMGSRMRSLKLLCSAWNPCVCKVGGSVWRPLILENGRQPGHVARAGQLRGLGISLKKGYVMKDHVIVDENQPVESTGDVIEKLKVGFKKFKEGEYRCVDFYQHVDLQFPGRCCCLLSNRVVL